MLAIKEILALFICACVWQGLHAAVPREGSIVGIYGGTPINITEAPYNAIFKNKKEIFFCGASIIHKLFLVTAAQCGNIGKLPDLEVIVGTDKFETGGTHHDVEKLIVHPEYSRLDYDMAVIKVKTEMVFNIRVQPIKMADYSVPIGREDSMQAIGFGLTEHGALSKELLMVKLLYINNTMCREAYDPLDLKVTDRMICAGGEAGKGDCNGDAGSALTYKNLLFGVASWVYKPCGTKGYPTVFGNVPSMKTFIEDVIKNNI